MAGSHGPLHRFTGSQFLCRRRQRLPRSATGCGGRCFAGRGQPRRFQRVTHRHPCGRRRGDDDSRLAPRPTPPRLRGHRTRGAPRTDSRCVQRRHRHGVTCGCASPARTRVVGRTHAHPSHQRRDHAAAVGARPAARARRTRGRIRVGDYRRDRRRHDHRTARGLATRRTRVIGTGVRRIDHFRCSGLRLYLARDRCRTSHHRIGPHRRRNRNALSPRHRPCHARFGGSARSRRRLDERRHRHHERCRTIRARSTR